MAVKEKTHEELMNEKMESKINEMMMNAQKQADGIIEKAEKLANDILEGTKIQVENTMPREELKLSKDLEELVQVRLFKDTNKYKDDVYVAVNGENCIIQRGIPVMIKKKFAIALEQSAMQDEFAASMMQGLSNDYREKEKQLI